jgi:hypothetical protein
MAELVTASDCYGDSVRYVQGPVVRTVQSHCQSEGREFEPHWGSFFRFLLYVGNAASRLPVYMKADRSNAEAQGKSFVMISNPGKYCTCTTDIVILAFYPSILP